MEPARTPRRGASSGARPAGARRAAGRRAAGRRAARAGAGGADGDIPVGTWFLAGVVPVTVGLIQFTAGVAVLRGNALCASEREWPFQLDPARWGWLPLVLGVVLVTTGTSLLSGRARARTAVAVLAPASAVASCSWLSWYPVRGAITIALNLLVVVIVALHGKGPTAAGPPDGKA